jgi:hypothetical protein
MEFFTTTAPWCELDEGYQKYLHTMNLIERLSLVLSDLISKRYASPLLWRKTSSCGMLQTS